MKGIGEEPPYDDDRKSIDDGDVTGIGEEKPYDDDRIVEQPPYDDGRKTMDDPEFALLIAEARKEAQESRDDDSDESWDDDLETWYGYYSDSEGFQVGMDIKRHQWRPYYNIGLCARIGLYCYNFQMGKDYDFGFVRKLYTRQHDSFSKSFIKLEAVNPSDESPLAIETCVKHNDEQVADGVGLWWETCICRVQGSEEVADHEWEDKAINDYYIGEMPNWLSDDDKQRCYVVGEFELLDMDNWWLPLFAELAFYTKWSESVMVRDIAMYPPLMPQHVFVETRGEAETEPRDKLKAPNAIFYISFRCDDDPETGELSHYRAVVRKTMDGKPGHMRLEVKVLEHLTEERPRKRTKDQISATSS